MKKRHIEVENQPEAVTETEVAETEVGSEPLVPVEPGTVSPEQLAELKERAAKADEHWDRLLRTTADLDNFKKRATREKQDAIKYANEGLLQKLVPLLDNLEMALQATKQPKNDAVQSLQTGIQMVYQQFKNVLAENGLEEIEAL